MKETYNTVRDCEHGHLKRKCPFCEHRVEIAEYKQVLTDCIPLIRMVGVIHHRKTSTHPSVDENDELQFWTTNDGCHEDCPGCQRIKDRDAMLDRIKEILR